MERINTDRTERQTERPLSLRLNIIQASRTGEDDEIDYLTLVGHKIENNYVNDAGILMSSIHKSECEDYELPVYLNDFFYSWGTDYIPENLKDWSEISKVAQNDGVWLVFPCDTGCYVCPFAVIPKARTTISVKNSYLSDALSYSNQTTMVIMDTSSSHHGNLVHCSQRLLRRNILGGVVGVPKNTFRGTVHEKLKGRDIIILQEARKILRICTDMINWFRQIRIHVAIIRICMSPKFNQQQCAAEEYMNDWSVSLTSEEMSMFYEFVNSKTTESAKTLKSPINAYFAEKLPVSMKYVLAAVCDPRSRCESPKLTWEETDVILKKFRGHILQHSRVFPIARFVDFSEHLVKWGDLINFYKNFGNYCIPDFGEDTIHGRTVPDGRWEYAIVKQDNGESLCLIPPESLHEFDVVLTDKHRRNDLRVQTLDEQHRTQGIFYSSATQEQLEGGFFRVDLRKGQEFLGIDVPVEDDDDEEEEEEEEEEDDEERKDWEQEPIKNWQHLNKTISESNSLHISTFSAFAVRKTGVYHKGKNHYISLGTDKGTLNIVKGIGQPTEEESKMLLDATTVCFMKKGFQEYRDTTNVELFYVARQVRFIFAVMGLIVNKKSKYGKRGLVAKKSEGVDVSTRRPKGSAIKRSRQYSNGVGMRNQKPKFE